MNHFLRWSTFLLLFIPLSTEAQIFRAVRGGLSGEESDYFSGNLSMNFSVNNRSSTVENDIIFTALENHGDLTYFSQNHAYITIAQANYHKVTNGPFISNGFGHFRVNFLRKNQLSYETFSQLQYDEGRRMPFRFLSGGGLRYRLKDKNKSEYFFGVGIMYEREHWESPTEGEDLITRDIPKSTNYLSAKILFNDHVELDAVTYYQVGWDNVSELWRHRATADILFTFKVTSKLSLRNSVSLLYDARPIIPINDFVFSIRNGFTYSLSE